MNEIFLSSSSLKVFSYLALVLAAGTMAIQLIDSLRIYETHTVRKFFHILAFVLFFPGMLANVSA